MNHATYNAIAAVLAYPETNYSQALAALQLAIPPVCDEYVAPVRSTIGSLTLQAQQELFTQTFDLTPLCSLELGWHLFGENYERGLLLVRMREELRTAGIPEEAELPDHLTYALRLLPTMQHERALDFAGAIVLPALMKMLQAIGGKRNPYEGLLSAIALLLRTDFPEIDLPEIKVELPVLPQEVVL
jgi:nitrate reductase delta subunit